ncbi:hypothetical protein H6781_00245 [Candidatus Nomurabacteria bacterium]|nr:hypothetical protein [Candidatus Kaiserbacteria bacterium]MCB9810012.1 hypothetical protein [Candidatus Nomurabacteria bacterium]
MINHLTQSALYAMTASITIVSLAFLMFFIAEPAISHGQNDTATFYIRQQITDETSFLVDPTDVTMAGGINGVTGGNATGTTQFVVTTNNTAGYRVDIAYEDLDTDGEAMLGDASGDNAIRDYDGDVVGEPSYNWTASTAAQFAYSVSASNTPDADQSFKSNGTNACNTGSTDAGGLHCWKAPDTGAFTIIDRSSSAVTGATSTIFFKIVVPSAATPVPQAETYTATATLSLYAN